MTQYGFFFDSTRCTGCRTCEMACKDYKDLPASYAFRRVFDYEGGTWANVGEDVYTTEAYAYHVSLSCNHCERPACLGKCPQGAISKDDKTGRVTTDKEKCIGCGTCVQACPYHVPVVDPEEMKSVRCDMCADRTEAGKMPICVEACPLRALDFGDVEALRAAHAGAVDAIAPLPSGSETTPSLVILPCPAAKEPGDTTGMIANELEVANLQ